VIHLRGSQTHASRFFHRDNHVIHQLLHFWRGDLGLSQLPRCQTENRIPKSDDGEASAFCVRGEGHKKRQNNENCFQILSECKKSKPEPLVVPLFVEAEYKSWSNQELTYYCQLRSPSYVHYDVIIPPLLRKNIPEGGSYENNHSKDCDNKTSNLVTQNVDTVINSIGYIGDEISAKFVNDKMKSLTDLIELHLKNYYGRSISLAGD
jgi:hypothetical protein